MSLNLIAEKRALILTFEYEKDDPLAREEIFTYLRNRFNVGVWYVRTDDPKTADSKTKRMQVEADCTEKCNGG